VRSPVGLALPGHRAARAPVPPDAGWRVQAHDMLGLGETPCSRRACFSSRRSNIAVQLFAASGAPGSRAFSALTTAGSASYSTVMASAASCASARLWATTAATGRNPLRARRHGPAEDAADLHAGTSGITGTCRRSLRSSPVTTVTTPGSACAARTCMGRMLACG